MNPFSLEGKNIVVTGASSGIGRQCAIDISNNGANIILIGRNNAELVKTANLCKDNVLKYIISADLSNLDIIPELVKTIRKEVGPIGGFVHCAGVEKTLPYTHLLAEDYLNIYKINVLSAMEFVKVISKKQNRAENTKFVLISSITAIVGRPGVAAYAASKGALVSVVKSIALEMAPKGMNINCISPGTIMTPLMKNMMESLTEEQRKQREDGFPLGIGKPTDISYTAIFLLSDAARWITGQNIIVDGGYTIV